jgi:hypothetical protein
MQITRAEIAKLLHHGDTVVARKQAEALIQDDVSGDLLEQLETHVRVILQHVNEMNRGYEVLPNYLSAIANSP